MKKIENVLFDWSGTISDDLERVYNTNMRLFEMWGLKTMSLEEFRRIVILPYMDFYYKFKKDISIEEVKELFKKEYALGEKTKPFPSASRTLDFLKEKGVKMIILSSHTQELLEKEAREYGFEKHFLEINGSVHNKVEEINSIIERNGFDPKKTVYVGDMVHDINAGKEGKIGTIAITWGYDAKEKLLTAQPDFVIDDLVELKNFF